MVNIQPGGNNSGTDGTFTDFVSEELRSLPSVPTLLTHGRTATTKGAEQTPVVRATRLTIRESRSRDSGASLDVRESSTPAKTLLPEA